MYWKVNTARYFFPILNKNILTTVASTIAKTCAVCSHRLSKELQHKDKIIESLHTKLQQRPDTPSSCQALSETTDQSDRTSLVSDEYRTNEDVDLSSDLDAREYQGEQRPGRGSERDGIVELSLQTLLPCTTSPLSFHSPFLQSVHLSLLTITASSSPPAAVPTCFARPLWVCSESPLEVQDPLVTRQRSLAQIFHHSFSFTFCCSSIQPFSLHLSPPPSLASVAQMSGAHSRQTPDPEPCLSLLFAQSWTHCTER